MFWKGRVKSYDLKMIEMLWKDEEASSSCEETHQHPRVEAVLYGQRFVQVNKQDCSKVTGNFLLQLLLM